MNSIFPYSNLSTFGVYRNNSIIYKTSPQSKSDAVSYFKGIILFKLVEDVKLQFDRIDFSLIIQIY